MNKIHFTDADGFITGCQISSTVYEDGKSYSAGSICRKLPPELINKDIAELRDYQFFGGAFIKRTVRPTDHITNWDSVTETWIADLTRGRAMAWSLLKTTLYDFITISSGFPMWKQVNYADKFNELTIKKLTASITTQEQLEIDRVVQVRKWKAELLQERDRVKLGIFSSENEAQIKGAVQGMVYIKPPFPL